MRPHLHADAWITHNFMGWFDGFDVGSALSVCELAERDVEELCRLMTTRKWCLHPDLGIYMGRHSALNSYLLNILGAVCGIIGRRGGNIFPGMVMPLGYHADERNPKVWKTVVAKMPPAAAGSFPPSALPDEILTEVKKVGQDLDGLGVLLRVNPDIARALNAAFFHHLPVMPQGRDIAIIADGIEGYIGHAQLFALIDIGRAFEHMQSSGQHLCGFFRIVFIISESG